MCLYVHGEGAVSEFVFECYYELVNYCLCIECFFLYVRVFLLCMCTIRLLVHSRCWNSEWTSDISTADINIQLQGLH